MQMAVLGPLVDIEGGRNGPSAAWTDSEISFMRTAGQMEEVRSWKPAIDRKSDFLPKFGLMIM